MDVRDGYVLCGGRSSRMGADKALVRWEGVPMAARVAAALRAGGCLSVHAVGGDREALAGIGLLVVPDLHPGEGPLGGLITALRHAAGRPVIVVSCDLPLLDGRTVAAVAGALAGHDASVPSTDRVQPLCAAWSPSALSTLEAAFAAGERSLRRVLPSLAVATPAVEGDVLRNVNRPDDVAPGQGK